MVMQLKLVPDLFVKLAKESRSSISTVFSQITENDKRIEVASDDLMAFILADEGIVQDFQDPDALLKSAADISLSDEILSSVLGVRLVDSKIPENVSVRDLLPHLTFTDKGEGYPVYCTVDMGDDSRRPRKEVLRDLLQLFYVRKGMDYVNTRTFRKYLAE